MNIFSRIKSIWQKPKVVVVAGDDKEMIKRIVSQILGTSFKVEKEILFVDDVKKISFPLKNYLILDYNSDGARKIKDENPSKILTFGFQEDADFRASDIIQNGRTNFKINYQGNIVPVWLKNGFGQKEISSVLAAAAVGTVFGLNLVEISQSLTQ